MFDKINPEIGLKLKTLRIVFESRGFKLRLVGGAVRDLLMDKIPHDFDLCTDATPDEMMDLASHAGLHVIPTGISHGTLSFVVEGELFEITTLRIDQNCDGRHADVEFTRSFEQDAARRDFTINAMSMDFDGNVFDFFGGQEDLKNHIIRFVGNPEDRIREDFLRVFRFFRFLGKFDGIASLDPVAFELISQDWVKEGVKTISVERIWTELKNMLSSKCSFNQFHMMNDVGLLNVIGLEFVRSNRTVVKNFRTASQLLDVSPIARLATFFDALWVEEAERFGRKMKMSLDEIKELIFIVDHICDNMLALRRLLAMEERREWVLDIAKITAETFKDFEFVEKFNPPKFPVSGKDLIELGMKPGPDMGETLRRLRSKWVNEISKNEVSLTKEKLLEEINK